MNPLHPASLTLDGAAVSVVVASSNGWLAPSLHDISLVLTIVWLSIQVGSWAFMLWKNRK